MNAGFPHPRGDGPASHDRGHFLAAISPPTWGWPESLPRFLERLKDFPTHVGMARASLHSSTFPNRFPHPRGDGPMPPPPPPCSPPISPPTWGWPVVTNNLCTVNSDFPTHVGMARGSEVVMTGTLGFPHPRGDGPGFDSPKTNKTKISPPTWGWPAVLDALTEIRVDFPTHVGMARSGGSRIASLGGFPHPRGDGPRVPPYSKSGWQISPPTWGWPAAGDRNPETLEDFPTHVGMARCTARSTPILRRFPHPRGDGPSPTAPPTPPTPISPPTWGWPAQLMIPPTSWIDFPTHVGMARARQMAAPSLWRFPHPRGDGPTIPGAVGAAPAISPPTWGWPALPPSPPSPKPDFPTHVGMARHVPPKRASCF